MSAKLFNECSILTEVLSHWVLHRKVLLLALYWESRPGEEAEKGRMSGPGYNLPFELGDAMAEETHQFCAGEFVFVATRAQLYQLKGQATIRDKFAGRPWTHSADPDCEMWGSCKDLTGSQTALSREPWLRFCHYRWLV